MKSEVKVKVLSDSCNLMDYIVHGIPHARILEWVAFPSPGDLPNPGIEPRSPTLQADALTSAPPRVYTEISHGNFLLNRISSLDYKE